MDNLNSLLQELRKKPYDYLKRPTLKYLHAFISGYVVYSSAIGLSINLEFFQEFQKFIERKFEITLAVHHLDIIEFYCIDEEEAFNKYFELLDEYNNLKV